MTPKKESIDSAHQPPITEQQSEDFYIGSSRSLMFALALDFKAAGGFLIRNLGD